MTHQCAMLKTCVLHKHDEWMVSDKQKVKKKPPSGKTPRDGKIDFFQSNVTRNRAAFEVKNEIKIIQKTSKKTKKLKPWTL